MGGGVGKEKTGLRKRDEMGSSVGARICLGEAPATERK